MTRKNARAGLLAGAGAAVLTVLAVAGAVALLATRSGEQKRFMDARGALCRDGKTEMCDALRSACDKRSLEACDALAEAYLSPGARHDAAEALRILEEACSHHDADACARGGKLLVSGAEAPLDAARGEKLLARACELGRRDACAPSSPRP